MTWMPPTHVKEPEIEPSVLYRSLHEAFWFCKVFLKILETNGSLISLWFFLSKNRKTSDSPIFFKEPKPAILPFLQRTGIDGSLILTYLKEPEPEVLSNISKRNHPTPVTT
jgi:hypothetical protein